MSKVRKAVYAGTFDPITSGHLNIIQRGSQVFDELIVAIAKDNYKQNLFDLEERTALVEASVADMENVRVVPFSGLLVDFCIEQGAGAIVRGLRVTSDFDHEFQMALMNRKLKPELDTVFFVSDSDNLFVSSSIVKSVAELGGHVEDLVPPVVAEAMKKKYAEQKKA